MAQGVARRRSRLRAALANSAAITAPVGPAVPPQPWEWPSADVRAQVMAVCAGRPSVAEIAAHLRLPLGVARVVVGDLVVQGYVTVHDTMSATTTTDERRDLIGRTLRGLRAL